MKLNKIVSWLDRTLKVADFDDVSNNGLQVMRSGDEVKAVAFAVDASVRAVNAAAEAGAQLLVVHHGISWGGGIRRVSGGVGNVVRAAMGANLAVYACHLPLDAHETLGNNAQLAKLLGLRKVRKAFNYHGNVIGLVGSCPLVRLCGLLDRLNVPQEARARLFPSANVVNRTCEQVCLAPDARCNRPIDHSTNLLIGVCSGGAGEFAEEAKTLGCDVYLTGEASWGDVIAAENCGMAMVCAGHYETEVWGVRAVSKAMRTGLKLTTVDLTETLR